MWHGIVHHEIIPEGAALHLKKYKEALAYQ
jgi:hypothetical protein